jgi:hypothetical protein
VLWYRAVINFGGALTDGHCVNDLPAWLSLRGDVFPRRMIRLLRRCDISSFFSTPRTVARYL